jgi:hypothetical protein
MTLIISKMPKATSKKNEAKLKFFLETKNDTQSGNKEDRNTGTKPQAIEQLLFRGRCELPGK